MLLTKVTFQVSREASASPAVAHSAVLAAMVIGGVLLSPTQAMPGTATCTTAMAMRTGAPSLSRLVFLSVASGIDGINLFGSFDNLGFGAKPQRKF